jgi:hypothetical protein
MVPTLENGFCINRHWDRRIRFEKKYILDIDLHDCVFMVKNMISTSTMRLVFMQLTVEPQIIFTFGITFVICSVHLPYRSGVRVKQTGVNYTYVSLVENCN